MSAEALEVVGIHGSSANENTSFMYHLINAAVRAIESTTKLQMTSAITASEVSESFNRMLENGNNRLDDILDDLEQAIKDEDDYEITLQQARYSQATQEEASKETLLKGNLDVAQQATTQYSATIQQLIQVASSIGHLATSVGEMLKKTYN